MCIAISGSSKLMIGKFNNDFAREGVEFEAELLSLGCELVPAVAAREDEDVRSAADSAWEEKARDGREDRASEGKERRGERCRKEVLLSRLIKK